VKHLAQVRDELFQVRVANFDFGQAGIVHGR
jgi:hypothetical protein